MAKLPGANLERADLSESEIEWGKIDEGELV